MAIVYSYPSGTATLTDTVLGTQFDDAGNPTKSFPISDIVNLAVNAVTAGGWSGTFQSNGTAVPGSGAGLYRMTIVNGIVTAVTLVG